jgi:hypothetical protein
MKKFGGSITKLMLGSEKRMVRGSALQETRAVVAGCILRGSDSLFREFPAHFEFVAFRFSGREKMRLRF